MDKRIQLLANLAISVALFGLIFYLVGPGKIIPVLVKARPELLLLAVMTYVILNVVMSFRIKIILDSIGDRISTMDIFPSNLSGMLASDFTPARAGYFFTAFSLTARKGIELEKTMISIFGPQMFDFLLKVTCAGILLLIMLSQSGIASLILNALLLLAFLIGILFAGAIVFHPPFLAHFTFFETFPFVPSVFSFIRKMHLHSGKVLALKEKIILVTLFAWLIKGLEWTFLSQAIGITIYKDPLQNLLFIMVFQGAVTILQFLPLPTLAGAGASEAGFAGILVFFGIPLEVAVSFGFLTRLLMIVVDAFSLPIILDYFNSHSLEKSLEGISGMH